MLLNHLVKKIVDIISHTENFDNFVFCYYGVVLSNQITSNANF